MPRKTKTANDFGAFDTHPFTPDPNGFCRYLVLQDEMCKKSLSEHTPKQITDYLSGLAARVSEENGNLDAASGRSDVSERTTEPGRRKRNPTKPAKKAHKLIPRIELSIAIGVDASCGCEFGAGGEFIVITACEKHVAPLMRVFADIVMEGE